MYRRIITHDDLTHDDGNVNLDLHPVGFIAHDLNVPTYHYVAYLPIRRFVIGETIAEGIAPTYTDACIAIAVALNARRVRTHDDRMGYVSILDPIVA